MEHIHAITAVFELPQDLGAQNMGVFAFEHAPPWRGWSPEDVANLVQYRLPLDDGRRPTFRLLFRQLRVRKGIPSRAAALAFAPWMRALRPRSARLRRALADRFASAMGARAYATAVAVTAFVPACDLPTPVSNEWMAGHMTRCLAVLNRYLIAYGVEVNDHRVGPVYWSDLPEVIPIIAETQPVPEGRRIGADVSIAIREWAKDAAPCAPTVAALTDAASLFRLGQENSTPWFQALELTHTARRDGASGRYSAAVLSAGTAIEVLAASVVRALGGRRGWTATKIDGALESGFKNLLTHHVPPALGVPIDITDEGTPWGRWWANGYLLRNDVAHRGYIPSAEEAHGAVYAAMRVVAEVGRILDADPSLADLALGLPKGISDDDPAVV